MNFILSKILKYIHHYSQAQFKQAQLQTYKEENNASHMEGKKLTSHHKKIK